MSTTEISPEELDELLEKDPDEVLREHQGRLRELRERTGSERVAALIDAVLADYEDEDEDDEGRSS